MNENTREEMKELEEVVVTEGNAENKDVLKQDCAEAKDVQSTADFVSEAEVDLEESLADTEDAVSKADFWDDDEDEEPLEINSNDIVEQKKQPTGISKSPFSFRATTCNVGSKPFGKESVLSLVYTAKNGVRVAISKKKVLEPMNISDSVQVAYSEELKGIVLGTDLGGSEYNLKNSHGKAIIYNKELVEYLKEVFKLDFTATTTHSFYNVEFYEYENCGKIAIITKGGAC